MRTDETASLTFRRDGAQRYRRVIADKVVDLAAALEHLPRDHAGIRIAGVAALHPFLALQGSIGSVGASILGPASRPVRAVLFDKTAATNWSLPWHQDRTICVRKRVNADGFGPWTIKGGMQHVFPHSIFSRVW